MGRTVKVGNVSLQAGDLQLLIEQRIAGLRHSPPSWVVCCSSKSKLDYVLCYEAASASGVPFCPLPSHLNSAAAQTLAGEFPFPSRVFTDGEFWPVKGKPRPLRDWIDRAALIFLTSGSTGHRKLVFSTGMNIEVAKATIGERLRYGHSDTIINYLPMSFDYGFYQYLLSKDAGSSLVLVDEGFGLPTARQIDEAAATILPVVPSLLAGIQPLLGTRIAGLSLRKLTSTGEVLSEGLIERTRENLPSVEVFPMYGLTECKRVSILTPQDRPIWPGSVGRPLTCCTVDISHPNDSGVGEIVVKGDNVALGTYAYALPENSALVSFDGVLRTGDFGRLDADGFLYVEGRRDTLLKIMGIRISAREIENALLSLDQVISARVRSTSNTVEALCVVTLGCAATNLRRVLLDEFGSLASGIKITLVDELPVSENYKVSASRSDA